MTVALYLAGMMAVSSEKPLPRDHDAPKLGLVVASARASYVIGEPVVLRCALKNLASQPIEECRVDNFRDHGSVEVFLSDDGFRFSQYRMGIFPLERVFRGKQTLGAGADWTFELRVLYTFERPSRLAFERPGKYYVKMLYPLFSRSAPTRRVIESNVVEVQIQSPGGADAVIWRAIREPEFVYFLQSGLVKRDDREVPRKAVGLLRLAAGTAYESALRWALEQYYNDRRPWLSPDKRENDELLESIRSALHIPTAAVAFFSEDRRLDVKIAYHFHEWTSLEKVLGAICVKSGVELRVSPELATGKVQTLEVTETLREFMDRQAGARTVWVKESNAYKLVPRAGAPD